MAIEKVSYLENFDSHSNNKRTIVGLLKSASESPISVEQVRVVSVHEESILSNHWREYGEIYGVIGEAEFTLEDIKTKKRETYKMKTGDNLYIPKEVALKVKAPSGTVIICCSEKNERENGTHKYEIE